MLEWIKQWLGIGLVAASQSTTAAPPEDLAMRYQVIPHDYGPISRDVWCVQVHLESLNPRYTNGDGCTCGPFGDGTMVADVGQLLKEAEDWAVDDMVKRSFARRFPSAPPRGDFFQTMPPERLRRFCPARNAV